MQLVNYQSQKPVISVHVLEFIYIFFIYYLFLFYFLSKSTLTSLHVSFVNWMLWSIMCWPLISDASFFEKKVDSIDDWNWHLITTGFCFVQSGYSINGKIIVGSQRSGGGGGNTLGVANGDGLGSWEEDITSKKILNCLMMICSDDVF